MEYLEAIDYIHSTLKFGQKLGLENISKLLELMDNPERKLKFVHIAGTNGKGSVCSYIASVLDEAGYVTGLFTSPYIERFTERIRVNDVEIGEEELADITSYVETSVDIMVQEGYNHPTEFEIVTAIAFEYYRRKKCDIVVLEVGMGGRFDSTNVINEPLVSVITPIDIDHTEYLGNTLEDIAYEKAGIIKTNCDTVSIKQEKAVEDTLMRVSLDRNSRIEFLDDKDIELLERTKAGSIFSFQDERYEVFNLGGFQTENAALAIMTVKLLRTKGYNISDECIFAGIKNMKWAGRIEVVLETPLFILDGGHNEQGATVLYNTLREWYGDKKYLVIFGVMKDKEYLKMIDVIAPLTDEFYTVTVDNGRAALAEELREEISKKGYKTTAFDSIDEAVESALNSGKDICSFGSLYYIGDVKRAIANIKGKV